MPPKQKRPSANSRDKRHENGLAAPAKQIKKRKSSGQINGHAIKDALSPSSALNSQISTHQTLPSHASVTDSIRDESFTNSSASSDANQQARSIDEDFSGFQDDTRQEMDKATDCSTIPHTDGHVDLEIPLNSLDLTRTANSYESTTTVIQTHSVGDVVAILLLLLQIPSSMLTVVQICFAVLTIGNSSSAWSPISFVNTPEWLQGHAGNPSVLTMFLTSGVSVGIYFLICLPFGWEFILDFAQAVIAISLGGGANGKGKIHTLASAAIIGLGRIYHFQAMKQRFLDTLWDSLSNIKIIPHPLLAAPPVVTKTPSTAHGFFRALLEIHIIAQGILRVIRRSMTRQTETKALVGRHSHPEQPSCSRHTTASNAPDNANDGCRNSSTDGRPPGPPPLQRDMKDHTVNNGKRRRKQATLVRSLQPFWAAIANTKVTVTKEIEHSQISRDAFEANATDPNHLGDAIQRCSEPRVWITEIGDTEVSFRAMTSVEDDGTNRLGSNNTVSIRVNGTSWNSTIFLGEGTSDARPSGKGRIFGLTPSTNYYVEFISPEDDKILHTASLLTRPVANDNSNNVLNGPPQHALRPSSPMTTLRTSITAADSRLQEGRNQLKKVRRQHNSSLSSLKKEVEALESRLSSFGGSDERQRQRRLQFQKSIRQAQESALEYTAQLKEMGEIPESERVETAETQSKWRKASAFQRELRGQLDATKAESNRQESVARSESSSLQQRRERLAARLGKLNVQRDELTSSIAQNNAYRANFDRERAEHDNQRRIQEETYLRNIARMDEQRRDYENQSLAYEQQIQTLEAALSPPPMPGSMIMPQTPEDAYASLAHGPRHQSAISNNVSFQDNVATPPSHSRRGSILQKFNGTSQRARSSSMLSNVSAFTDAEACESPTAGTEQLVTDVFSPNQTGYGRHQSGGSGDHVSRAGSGNNSISQGDAASPLSKLNPIGTEVGRGSPSNTKA